MRFARWSVALTALAMILAACGGDGDGGGAGGSGDLKGTYKIGVWGPAQIPQGRDIRDGAILAAEELNKAKGAGGRKIETVFCDSIDGAKPDKAVACVTQLLQQDRVDAIVGGFSSGETLAVLDTVVKGQVPFVASGAASPDVVKGVASGNERKYIFRIGPINSLALAADMCVTYLKLAQSLGYAKVGILYEDVEFARPLQAFLAQCLAAPKAASKGQIPIEKGVEVAAVVSHAVDATDFSAQFKALTDKGAQLVLEINSRQEGVALVKQWGALKPKFALVGINVASQFDNFFEVTNKGAAYELNGPAGSVRAPITPKTEPFYDAFKAKFGRFPIYNGVSTYDAVHALAEAVDRAGSAKPDDVVAELEKTDRVGAQGREKFGPDHDVVYGPEGVTPVYFQWLPDGTKKLVFPEALAGGVKYQKPPWAP